MRSILQCLFIFSVICLAVPSAEVQSYPSIRPLQHTFDVPDLSEAQVVLDIKSVSGSPVYKLQCHAAGFKGDVDFDYSGDFECRLNSIGHRDSYSNLLTEDSDQSRDWESRGRFFAADLRGKCARIPQFGTERSFELRGMKVTLHVIDPVFTKNGKLSALKLSVKVDFEADARRPIAKIVPFPRTGVPAECKLKEYFVDPATFSKVR